MNVAYATMPFHSLTSQTSSTAFRIHQAKVQKTEGKVISVGPGNTHPESGKISPMPVNEGDGVVYGQYDGTEVEYNGDRHTLIRDSDILVKYTGDTLTKAGVEAGGDEG